MQAECRCRHHAAGLDTTMLLLFLYTGSLGSSTAACVHAAGNSQSIGDPRHRMGVTALKANIGNVSFEGMLHWRHIQ